MSADQQTSQPWLTQTRAATGLPRSAQQGRPGGGLAARYQSPDQPASRQFGEAAAPRRPHSRTQSQPPSPGRYYQVPGSRAPGIGPVIAFTFVFGVLGAISAANRAQKARAVGAPQRPYWLAFGATIAVDGALSVIALVVADAVRIAILG